MIFTDKNKPPFVELSLLPKFIIW